MSPEEIVKRLDRFETNLDQGMALIRTEVRDICVLVKVHDRQLLELHTTVAELKQAIKSQERKCSSRQLICPAEDIKGLKRWAYATIGAVITAALVAWAKIESTISKFGG